MMRIALDATPLTVQSGGVRRYTEELSRSLAENEPGDEIWLLSDQPFQLPSGAPPNLKCGRGPAHVLERRWWLWGLQSAISRHRIEVFHGTDFSVPYLPKRPSVMTLHDLSPWMNPSWHSAADRVQRRTPVLLRLGLATMVITPSEAVRRQAMERFHLDANSVVAIPHAASPHFHPVANSPAIPYFLYVGTLEPRKNLQRLLDAWREIRKTHPVDLILAGRRREDFPEPPPEPGLHLKGFTPEEELPSLYSSALACVYPSYYEGFGLPVLEAMQCGGVVIASRDASVSEVAADAAILVDAEDHRAWVEALEFVIQNPERMQQLRAAAVARASEFSWPKTARLTREVYQVAIARFRKQA